MRTSGLLVFVFATAAAPSLAAPLVRTRPSSQHYAPGSICQRFPAICAPMIARDAGDSAGMGWLPKIANFLSRYIVLHV